MIRILFLLFLLFVLNACSNKKTIVNSQDYNAILSDTTRTEKQVEKINAEISFWQNRLAKDTGSFVDMLQIASNHRQRFKTIGSVEDLHVADSLYAICLQKVKSSDPEIYFSVSQNAITQHRFNDAWNNLMLADSIGVNPYVLSLLRFDVAMEIGLYQLAAANIEKLETNNFDYLIRKARLEDHKGDLDNAIKLMEQALKDAEAKDKEQLILWAKSNLGDMYGHAGRVEESYKNYVDVLRTDSNYLYALKGIAWIAYSHDHNTKEAKRILNYILSQTNMPDLYLMLGEIEEWEGNSDGKDKYIAKFLSEVEKPGYGNMYNKYLITIYTEDKPDQNKALSIAEKEVSSRPTPETYSWLAWVHFKKGDKEKAFELVKNYVLDKDFEPESQLHAAYILKAQGETSRSNKILNDCLESSFELGPVITEEIKKNL
jgi:tetratricopeptide (TPR) repeat protein